MTTYTGYSAAQGGVIGQSEAVAYTPEIWIPATLRYRAREMAMSRYVQMISFDGKKGDTIRKPFIGRLKPRRKVAGSPVQFETRTEGEWKMVVDRHTYAGFSVDSKVDLFAEIDVAREYTPEIAQALMEDVEYSLLAERATFISWDPTNNHIVSTVPLAYADILNAAETMLLRGVPYSDMVMEIGPRHMVTLFTIDEFIQSGVFNSGDIANIRSGTIVGTIMGIPIVLNHNIRTNSLTGLSLGGNDYADIDPSSVNGAETSPTPGMAGSLYLPTQWGSDQDDFLLDDYLVAGYESALLHSRRAIALAMPKAPSLEMWWNADYQETRVLSTQVYDIKVQFPDEGIVISTDETASIA